MTLNDTPNFFKDFKLSKVFFILKILYFFHRICQDHTAHALWGCTPWGNFQTCLVFHPFLFSGYYPRKRITLQNPDFGRIERDYICALDCGVQNGVPKRRKRTGLIWV